MLKKLDDQTLKKIFLTIILTQGIIWILVPTFFRHAVSPDTIEAIVWAHQWQWGYDKNPWFVALVTRLGVLLGGKTAFGIYLLEQFFILIAFWSIWQLTQILTNARYAILASLMFLSTTVFVLTPQLNNDNYILVSLWPLSALLFFQACKTQRLSYWLSCAVILGLATMAKYDSVILVAAYGLYLLVSKEYRHYFANYKIYLAAFLYFLIVLPNLIWLVQHDFLALHYAFVERGGAGTGMSWLNFLSGNLSFLWNVFADFFPALLLLLLGISWQRKKFIKKPAVLSIAPKFIFWIGIMPFLIALLIALLGKFVLEHEWGLSFMGLWGTAILIFLKPQVTDASLRRFLIAVVIILVLWPVGYIIGAFTSGNEPWKGNYPAPEVAKVVYDTWQQHYHKPLLYIAGERHLAGYVNFYSTGKAAVFMDWNPTLAPWINLKKLRCEGAVFVQDNFQGYLYFSPDKFPDVILKQYPDLVILPAQDFYFYRNDGKGKKIKLLIGLLPPKNCE